MKYKINKLSFPARTFAPIPQCSETPLQQLTAIKKAGVLAQTRIAREGATSSAAAGY